jgi:thiosulfate dehydrogenase (quinone) large subunit
MKPVQSQQRPYISSLSFKHTTNPPAMLATRQVHLSGWVFLPLRLFLGITFVYAGIQKFTDPQFFHPSTPGYIGNQIIAFAHNSPIRTLLIHVALPHAMFFGFLIACGEIAIGLGTLVGLLARPAAFFGLLLSFIFFLSASWHVYPYFYGSDVVFIFAWLTLLLHGPRHTGLPIADTWLAETLFPADTVSSLDTIATIGRALLIGSPGITLPEPSEPDAVPITSLKPPTHGNRYRTVVQRKTQNRRSFLLGVLSGGASVAVLGITGLVMRGPGQGEGSNSPTPPADSVPTPIATSASGTVGTAGGAIAQVSSLPKNSATTFTIPSTGDPGVVIHLSNDQFVAYDAICTHAGCQVDYDVTSQQLICPCHGATYDPAHDAAVLAGPTQTPLTKVAIHIDGTTGAITLQS